jgi:lipopolysaccharide exporter
MGIEASFKQEAVTGIEWNGLSTLSTSAFQILQVSILSNFLSPTAFGIMAMAMVVIGFAQAFNDIGVSNAIIQRQDTTIEKLSSLYWLQIGLGCILFILVLLITPMTVQFFNEPALTGVMMLTSLTFLVAPVGQIFQILMQKELEFKTLALIDISSSLVSLVTAGVAAYMGLGVMALVWGQLAFYGLRSILFFLA